MDMDRRRRCGRLRPGFRVPAVPVLLAALILAFPVPLHSQTSSVEGVALCLVPDSIGRQLARIAGRVGGEMGVAAIHLETGARVSFNGDRRFPMASVSKLPMALEFLRRVDEGDVDLRERLEIPITDFRPGYSPLASWSGGRSEHATVDSLFRLMIGVSDNTATDLVLRLAGGPGAVTRRLRELGIREVDVNRSEARTFADLVGIPDTVPEEELYRYNYFRLRDRLPAAHRQTARARYGEDPRDTATPEAMADLLVLLFRGFGLSPASRDYLVATMEGSRSGPRRIKGLLPRGTTVAHKTGTMGGAINDVGIVTLPGNAGHLVVAAFVNTLNRTEWRRERTIAEATRLLYDHFSTAPDPWEQGPVQVACADAPTPAVPWEPDPAPGRNRSAILGGGPRP